MTRKKGRDVHGWLIVDKPAGIGSTTVVSRLRRTLQARKAGHAGTLDPDATGLLAVAFGEATKTVPFIESASKSYEFEVAWGAETTTDDAAGEVTARSDTRPGRAAIEAALEAFRGDILQVPPAVSAVKVDGARAYDLARAGQVVDLAARPLRVDELSLLDASPDGARLRMVCGKGGYVRSIARDLGRALGSLGHVAGLRREWSGPFTLDGAITPAELEDADAALLESRLLPVQAALSALPELRATAAGAVRLRNGNPGEVLGSADWGLPVWVSRNGVAVCVGRAAGGMVEPDRVFNLPDAERP